MLLLALSAAAPARAARRALPAIVQDDAQLLFQSDAQVKDALSRLQALGVQDVRVTASWSDLTRDPKAAHEPKFNDRDPAAYEQDKWALLDRVVRLAPQYGLGVMIDVGFWAPRWAARDRKGAKRPRTDINAAAYARFAQALAKRYAGGFTPPGQAPVPSSSSRGGLLAALLGVSPPAPPQGPTGPLPAVRFLSLWNEPNEPAFLWPQWPKQARRGESTSPAIYRRMVQAAYPAIKSVAPGVRVLVGGLSPHGHYGVQRGDMPPLRFIRAMACVDSRLHAIHTGSCRHFKKVIGDGWTHHPYQLYYSPGHSDGRSRPDNAAIGDIGRLTHLLGQLVARGRLSAHLRNVYITEFGYESNPPDRTVKWSLSQQARFLTWGEYLAASNPHVKMWAQFQLADGVMTHYAGGRQARRGYGGLQSGLFFADGKAKPAAVSFAAGLYAARRSRGRVLVWAHIRTGGVGAVLIQGRGRRGGWRSLASSGPLRDGVLQRIVRAHGAVRFRMVYRDARGRHVSVPVPAT